jgi:hypothetical protein
MNRAIEVPCSQQLTGAAAKTAIVENLHLRMEQLHIGLCQPTPMANNTRVNLYFQHDSKDSQFPTRQQRQPTTSAMVAKPSSTDAVFASYRERNCDERGGPLSINKRTIVDDKQNKGIAFALP